jgi:hypothetical protein
MIILKPLDISDLSNLFRYLPDKQLRFAQALALTRLAKTGQGLVREAMPQVFDSPTPYTLRSVGITPATPSSLQSDVHLMGMGNRWKFLEAEIEGGKRYQRGFENLIGARTAAAAGLQTVPGQAAPLDQYGNIPANLYNQVLSSLGAQRDSYANTTGRSMERRIRSGKAVDYFVGRPNGGGPLGIWSRTYTIVPAPADGRARQARQTPVTKAFARKIKKGYILSKIHPFLILIRPGTYPKRLAFYQMVQDMARQRYRDEFLSALQQAFSTMDR